MIITKFKCKCGLETDIPANPSTLDMITGVVVADAGNSTTQIKTDLPSLVNDAYNNKMLIITSGALVDKAMMISDYVGSTQILTLSAALGSIPATGVTFKIVTYK